MQRRYVILAGLFVLAAVLIGISGIPRFKNGHGLDGTIGGIGWFGGLLCALTFIVYAVLTVRAHRRDRRAPDASVAA
jgi:membrane associated rhomboid family serine protease